LEKKKKVGKRVQRNGREWERKWQSGMASEEKGMGMMYRKATLLEDTANT